MNSRRSKIKKYPKISFKKTQSVINVNEEKLGKKYIIKCKSTKLH